MARFNLVRQLEKEIAKPVLPSFSIGDDVDVHVKIKEGDKERIQIFHGTVIGRSGSGFRETFIVRRLVSGEGVERTFPLHSPVVADVKVVRRGKARGAKLYYMRTRTGKSTRLKEDLDLSARDKIEGAAKKAETPKPAKAKKEVATAGAGGKK